MEISYDVWYENMGSFLDLRTVAKLDCVSQELRAMNPFSFLRVLTHHDWMPFGHIITSDGNGGRVVRARALQRLERLGTNCYLRKLHFLDATYAALVFNQLKNARVDFIDFGELHLGDWLRPFTSLLGSVKKVTARGDVPDLEQLFPNLQRLRFQPDAISVVAMIKWPSSWVANLQSVKIFEGMPMYLGDPGTREEFNKEWASIFPNGLPFETFDVSTKVQFLARFLAPGQRGWWTATLWEGKNLRKALQGLPRCLAESAHWESFLSDASWNAPVEIKLLALAVLVFLDKNSVAETHLMSVINQLLVSSNACVPGDTWKIVLTLAFFHKRKEPQSLQTLAKALLAHGSFWLVIFEPFLYASYIPVWNQIQELMLSWNTTLVTELPSLHYFVGSFTEWIPAAERVFREQLPNRFCVAEFLCQLLDCPSTRRFVPLSFLSSLKQVKQEKQELAWLTQMSVQIIAGPPKSGRLFPLQHYLKTHNCTFKYAQLADLESVLKDVPAEATDYIFYTPDITNVKKLSGVFAGTNIKRFWIITEITGQRWWVKNCLLFKQSSNLWQTSIQTPMTNDMLLWDKNTHPNELFHLL